MTLNTGEFDFIRRLVRDRAAVVLEPSQLYLVESRLHPLAKDLGLDSVADLVGQLRRGAPADLSRRVVEAMVTHETSFFRDTHPFELLRTSVLPDLMARRASERRLSIWSAACSTGQEIYSIAMLLREHFPQLMHWTVRLLASDLSQFALSRAREGRYNSLEVGRGLPPGLLKRYFDPINGDYQVREDLRRSVEWRELNLAGDWPPLFANIDVVLLRNVLIYFDQDTKAAILSRVRRVLRGDGYLFLGGVESTISVDDSFERLPSGMGAVFRLKGAPAPVESSGLFKLPRK